MSEVSYMKVSLDQVKSNFSRFGLLDEQVKFLPGWFSDTLPTAPIQKLAILRLDGDLYSSTIDALQSLYFKVSKGGYVIVDDYDSWPGCKRAVTEFLAANSLEPKIESIDGVGCIGKCSGKHDRWLKIIFTGVTVHDGQRKISFFASWGPRGFLVIVQ